MLATLQFRIRLPSKNVKIKMYKTIILPVVVYACEAWALASSEEQIEGV
jgi:hypothetical protein